MEIFINHGILHIIDNERGQVVMSESELDLDSDMVADFLGRHIKKMIDGNDVKEATFKAESAMLATIGQYIADEVDFKTTSREICTKLAEIMLENGEIPPADLLITQFEMKNLPYLGIFKLNHSVFYTHEMKGGQNYIVQSSFALPVGGSKVTEAVIIPYSPMVLKIIEKPHAVQGEIINYFSQLFLEAGASLSKKQAAKLIKSALEDVVTKHLDGSPIATAKFQLTLIEEAIENDGEVRLESVALQAFGESEARDEFVTAVREAGIVDDLFLGEKFCIKEFGMTKIKSEGGVELKFPVGVMDDPNVIEFMESGKSFGVSVKDFRKG